MQVVMYQNQRILSMGCKKRGSYFAHAPSFNPSTAGKASSLKKKQKKKNAPALGLDDTLSFEWVERPLPYHKACELCLLAAKREDQYITFFFRTDEMTILRRRASTYLRRNAPKTIDDSWQTFSVMDARSLKSSVRMLT